MNTHGLHGIHLERAGTSRGPYDYFTGQVYRERAVADSYKAKHVTRSLHTKRVMTAA